MRTKHNPIFSVLALPLLVPLLSACGSSGGQGAAASTGGHDDAAHQEPPAPEAIPVEVGLVSHEAMSSLYSTSATLRADKRATVTARTTGIIRRLTVEEGDQVETGQPLAFLEDDEQKIAFERAVSARDIRQGEFERQQRLHSQSLVSDDVLETSRRESEDAQHATALAELTLSRTVIRAPFTGIILERHLDVGATVSTGTVIFDLADVDPLYADVNVPERHAVALTPGNQVRLAVDATGDRVVARIERISPDVDPETGTVKITVAVPPSAGLRAGSFARVDIVTATHADAVVVPRPALVAEGSRWHLFRLADDGVTVEQLRVEIGFEEGDRVEILLVLGSLRDLASGDAVVVVGAPALSDGSRVEVIEPAAVAG